MVNKTRKMASYKYDKTEVFLRSLPLLTACISMITYSIYLITTLPI